MEVYKLYPQFNNTDRRQNKVPVDIERRSNIDRRSQPSDDNVYFAERRVDAKLRQDIYQVKDVFQSFKPGNTVTSFTNDLGSGAENAIPYVRRLRGVNDAFEHHDYMKAVGTALLMLMNVKEDWRDLLKIFRKPNNIPRDYQIPFSFTRGTPLEKIEIFKKYDKTFNDTNIGNAILNKLGMTDYKWITDASIGHNKTPLMAFKAEGSILAKLTARTFMRIPVLSFMFLSILEIPSIIKSKEPSKQIVKSIINVSSIIMGGALIGALGAYFGPLGSLAGIGIGSFYAGKFAKKLNSTI